MKKVMAADFAFSKKLSEAFEHNFFFWGGGVGVGFEDFKSSNAAEVAGRRRRAEDEAWN